MRLGFILSILELISDTYKERMHIVGFQYSPACFTFARKPFLKFRYPCFALPISSLSFWVAQINGQPAVEPQIDILDRLP